MGDVITLAAMGIRLDFEMPKSLSAAVEERIRTAIIDGELAFGQALSEDGTGLAMGVSRTPMREALTRLQAQGLVVIVPKRGTFVFNPSVADVEQLAAFRLVLETTGAGLCLAHRREQTINDMNDALTAMVGAKGDGTAYARADTAFHESLFANCGNSYLVTAYRTISWQVAALRAHLSVPRANEQEVSFDEHQRMVACFEQRQRAPLMQLLQRHIMRSAGVYAEAVKSKKAVLF